MVNLRFCLTGALLAIVALGPATLNSCRTAEAMNYTEQRLDMVERQIRARGVSDPAVLEALRTVPRHEFIPPRYRDHPYGDHPVPIGEGQTISQPYMVALMTECLKLKPTDRVLEIGTGSGYQAAVLSVLAAEVYTIEIVEPLGRQAAQALQRLGYSNVHVRIGNGYLGWPEKAPFDAIIVTCAPDEVPQALEDQLAEGGRLVVPVGSSRFFQTLQLLTKRDGKISSTDVTSCVFVPMTGKDSPTGKVEDLP